MLVILYRAVLPMFKYYLSVFVLLSIFSLYSIISH